MGWNRAEFIRPGNFDITEPTYEEMREDADRRFNLVYSAEAPQVSSFDEVPKDTPQVLFEAHQSPL